MAMNSDQARVPWMRRIHPAGWLLVCGLAILAAMAAVQATPYRGLGLVIEAAIYLGWIWFFLSHAEVRAHLARAPVAFRIFAALLIACLVAGQLANVPRWTYPFVNWTMYSTQSGVDPVYQVIAARTDDGSTIDLPINALPLGRRRIEPRLIEIAFQTRSADLPRADAAKRLLNDAVRSIVQLHQRPGGPRIRKVTFTQYRIPIPDYRGPGSITSELIAEVDL